MPLPNLLALFAALLFASAALFIKRAADLGVSSLCTVFVANLVSAVLFQVLLVFGGTFHIELWWQPAIVAMCFIAGQWLTFFSLERGDVSVATPVMGIKILLVATFVTLLGGQTLDSTLWIAAALATAGIALLNRRSPKVHHHVGMTIATASLAATAFALFDVLVQKWSPAWGLGRFLPTTIGMAGVASFVFLPRARASLRGMRRKARPWLFAGALSVAGQALIFVSTIAYWGQAATANVIYSSRGLWSVLLVWLFGHWLESREKQLGRAILGWRLAGATLMMAAIVLVLV
ncbi:MAG: EamA family transporter [Planctomycetales bacterium]|nr:EamA family transporter [Planctomycetales bacterium]